MERAEEALRSGHIDKIIDALTELVNSTKTLEVRQQKGSEIITYLGSTLDWLHNNQPTDKPEHGKACTAVFRIFRNLCANVPQNQESIRELGFLKTSVSYMSLLASVDNEPAAKEAAIARRSVVQFLGNFVVGNVANAEAVWNTCFPGIFVELLESADVTIHEATAMLIYNCILKSEVARQSLRVDLKIVPLLLKNITNEDSEAHKQIFEWTYFTFKKLFSEDHFMEMYTLHSAASPSCTVDLLKILDGMVIEYTKSCEGLPSSGGLNILSSKIVTQGLCSAFTAELNRLYNKDFKYNAAKVDLPKLEDLGVRSDTMMNGGDDDDEVTRMFKVRLDELKNKRTQEDEEKEKQKPMRMPGFGSTESETILETQEYEIVYFILEIFGSLTSFVGAEDFRTKLGKEGLLAIVIGTLQGLYEMDERAKKDGQKIQINEGYKVALIRILANMCYGNKDNQDEIRELKGIPLILNHITIDEKNPYIREWAIFAVRNLLQDNPENQQIISNLSQVGVAPNRELAELGLRAEIVNGVIKLRKDENKPNQDDDGI